MYFANPILLFTNQSSIWIASSWSSSELMKSSMKTCLHSTTNLLSLPGLFCMSSSRYRLANSMKAFIGRLGLSPPPPGVSSLWVGVVGGERIGNAKREGGWWGWREVGGRKEGEGCSSDTGKLNLKSKERKILIIMIRYVYH